VIVGAVTHEDAQKLAKKSFEWIPRAPEPPRVSVREPQPTEPKSITIKADNAPSPVVGVLFRTFPANHDDYVAIQMVGSILGAGESSRLHRKIVAQDQSAMIALAGAFSLEQDGGIAAGALLAPFGGDTKKVLATIEAEIERLRSEPVTPEELEKARNQMLKGVVAGNLSVESKASLLGNAAVVEGDVARVNRRIDDIRRVTADDLMRVAKQYMTPEKEYSVVVERNLLGMLFGRKKTEDDAPITAAPETDPPPPGRPGLTRPPEVAGRPPIAPPLDTIPKPEIRSKTLENGLKVIVVRNSEVPFVTIQFGLLAGGWSEEKPGTANMALEMLTKGTARHDEAQLAEELDRLAISLDGSAGMDSANVVASCVREQAERALQLLAEVVRQPTFPEGEFEKLRRRTQTTLAVAAAEPAYIADRELRKRVFGDHPYSRTPTGEVEQLDALTVADLSAWWKNVARPESARLIFAGDIEFDAAVNLAQSALGDWKPEPGPQPRTIPSPPGPAETRIYLVDRAGVQSQIRVAQLGMTRDNPRYFTSRVVSGYFGGAFASRLNETIRVKKGLTYGASGGWSADRFAGTFRVGTFSKNETTADAVKAIFDELERLRSEPPAEDELEKTKSYILGSFAGDRETPQQVAGDVWLRESCGLPEDYFERMLKTVRSTAADECTTLVRESLDPTKLVVVVVGPAAQLKEQLEKIAPVTVVQPSTDAAADDDSGKVEAR
jgi:zinc protease